MFTPQPSPLPTNLTLLCYYKIVFERKALKWETVNLIWEWRSALNLVRLSISQCSTDHILSPAHDCSSVFSYSLWKYKETWVFDSRRTKSVSIFITESMRRPVVGQSWISDWYDQLSNMICRRRAGSTEAFVLKLNLYFYISIFQFLH